MGKLFLTLTPVCCPKLLVLGANCFMSNINGLPRIVEEGMDHNSLQSELYLRRQKDALIISDEHLNTVADVKAYRKGVADDKRREEGKKRMARKRKNMKKKKMLEMEVKRKEARQEEEKKNEVEVAAELVKVLNKTREGEEAAVAAALVAQRERSEQVARNLRGKGNGGAGGDAGGGGGGGGGSENSGNGDTGGESDGEEGEDMSEGGGGNREEGDGGESSGKGAGSDGSRGGGTGAPHHKAGIPGGVQGESIGERDFSKAVEDALRCAVFRFEKRRKGCSRGKHWVVVGLDMNMIHQLPFKFGKSTNDSKHELARTLIMQFGMAWREKFKAVRIDDE